MDIEWLGIVGTVVAGIVLNQIFATQYQRDAVHVSADGWNQSEASRTLYYVFLLCLAICLGAGYAVVFDKVDRSIPHNLISALALAVFFGAGTLYVYRYLRYRIRWNDHQIEAYRFGKKRASMAWTEIEAYKIPFENGSGWIRGKCGVKIALHGYLTGCDQLFKFVEHIGKERGATEK